MDALINDASKSFALASHYLDLATYLPGSFGEAGLKPNRMAKSARQIAKYIQASYSKIKDIEWLMSATPKSIF